MDSRRQMMAATARIVYELNLSPRTTLTHDLTAGDTSIQVADPSIFAEDGLVVWPDRWFIYSGKIASGVNAPGSVTVQLSTAFDLRLPTPAQLPVGSKVKIDSQINRETVTVTAITTSGGLVTAFTATFAQVHVSSETTWETLPPADEPLGVLNDPVGNVVAADFTGLGYSGFQYSKPAGTEVATNLVTYMPTDFTGAFSRGNAMLSVMAMEEYSDLMGQGLAQECFRMQVLYRFALLKTPGSDINQNVWGFRQQEQADDTLGTMLRAIRGNPRLQTSDGWIHAEDLGVASTAAERGSIDWNRAVMDQQTLMLSVPLRFRVRALQVTF